MTAVSAEDEEFGHVPYRGIARYQDKPGGFVVNGHEEGVPGRLTPIEGELVVREPAVGFNFHVVEFAEVMRVELEQVGQERLLLGCGGSELSGQRCFQR